MKILRSCWECGRAATKRSTAYSGKALHLCDDCEKFHGRLRKRRKTSNVLKFERKLKAINRGLRL